MQKELWIKKIVENLTEVGSNTAVECVKAMFQKKCSIRDPWYVADRLEGTFNYIFSLVSTNERFKSTMCIGVQLENIKSFIGYDIDIEEAKDAFGEFANIYCAMLMDSKKFNEYFGILVQSLPEDAVNQTFFPLAWCFNGKLYIRKRWIYIGYSIKEESFKLPF